jgi:tRNA (cytidine/uridine-2'-O-)-methyltransferase
MIHVVLYQPEIPPNTGNVARTCAATGCPLHLVEPLGFSLSDRHLRRAGLDYWNQLNLTIHPDEESFLGTTDSGYRALISTRGTRPYTEIGMAADGASVADIFLVFGPETRGLPADLLTRFPRDVFRVPMLPQRRSLNLANTVALVLYEQLRLRGFPDLL